MLDRIARQAVTHQSWNKESVRTAVAELREKNPKADDAALARLFAERMRADDKLLEAAAEYVVILAVNSIERSIITRTTNTPQARIVREAQQTSVVAAIKEHVMMINMEMPNGKRMRWCTGAEMVNFGGAFQKIGKKAGSTKTVGAVLDEKQVRQFLK
jgi:hypothetical protein